MFWECWTTFCFDLIQNLLHSFLLIDHAWIYLITYKPSLVFKDRFLQFTKRNLWLDVSMPSLRLLDAHIILTCWIYQNFVCLFFFSENVPLSLIQILYTVTQTNSNVFKWCNFVIGISLCDFIHYVEWLNRFRWRTLTLIFICEFLIWLLVYLVSYCWCIPWSHRNSLVC